METNGAIKQCNLEKTVATTWIKKLAFSCKVENELTLGYSNSKLF
jgi:hypothetical protein